MFAHANVDHNYTYGDKMTIKSARRSSLTYCTVYNTMTLLVDMILPGQDDGGCTCKHRRPCMLHPMKLLEIRISANVVFLCKS